MQSIESEYFLSATAKFSDPINVDLLRALSSANHVNLSILRALLLENHLNLGLIKALILVTTPLNHMQRLLNTSNQGLRESMALLFKDAHHHYIRSTKPKKKPTVCLPVCQTTVDSRSDKLSDR